MLLSGPQGLLPWVVSSAVPSDAGPDSHFVLGRSASDAFLVHADLDSALRGFGPARAVNGRRVGHYRLMKSDTHVMEGHSADAVVAASCLLWSAAMARDEARLVARGNVDWQPGDVVVSGLGALRLGSDGYDLEGDLDTSLFSEKLDNLRSTLKDFPPCALHLVVPWRYRSELASAVAKAGLPIVPNVHVVRTLSQVYEALGKVVEHAKERREEAEAKAIVERPWSRRHPGCLVLLVDQSGSMADVEPRSGLSKSEVAANAVNDMLKELVRSCTRDDEVVDRCQVGIIGYGDGVHSALLGVLQDRELVPIDQIYDNVHEVRPRRGDHGALAGAPQPVWIEPRAGGGTPMTLAFSMAQRWVQSFCEAHPNSAPPLVVNLTDGLPNSLDRAGPSAESLRNVRNTNGPVRLFNVHITTKKGRPVRFPRRVDELPERAFPRFLFHASSALSAQMVAQANGRFRWTVEHGARGFIYGEDPAHIVKLLRFFSQPAGR
ncbi:MAG: hypothetical protein ACI9MC_001617 [Kiritimatiellia bacterium]|jgi:hypothetical protein